MFINAHLQHLHRLSLPPPLPSQTGPVHARFSRGWAEIGVDLRGGYPRPIPDWRGLERLCLNWRRVERLCFSDPARYRRSRRFRRSFDLITRSRYAPHPCFSTFIATKALIQFDAWASLAPRLGGPWATLGPPKGHPNPIPIPIPIPTNPHSRAAFAREWAESESAEGRKSSQLA